MRSNTHCEGWGVNPHGQLRTGDTTNRPRPVNGVES
jgi:hypothetical protein